MASKISSPSHRYVAICPHVNRAEYGPNFYSCVRFDLPQTYANNCAMALWYYMNVLDHLSMVDVVITREAFDAPLGD